MSKSGSARDKAQRHESAIFVIGGVLVDLIMGAVAPWPRPGTETFVDHSEMRAGGPAGNTALALEALGVPYRLVTNIGDDMFGAWLVDTFAAAATEWPKAATPTAISVAIGHPGGERSFLTAEGHLAAQTVPGILEAMPRRAVAGDVALLTGAFLYPHLNSELGALLATLADRGFSIALDTGWPPGGWTEATRAHTASWLPVCDHVLFNEVESRSLSGEADVEQAAAWLARRAKPEATVAVKRGAEGATVWHKGAALHVAAPVVDVVDTTGAGDAFNAGYLGARLLGSTVETAVREGVAVASAAIASSPRTYRRPQESIEPTATN